ncbi:MAG: geranylgeranylglyceryl/heptaprenylglyceryl phosphate synthase [Candidatus Bathyarchaeia archaeon]
MLGKVEEYLLKRMQENVTIHITLIDPEKVTCESASFLARESEICGSSAIMVGGTTLVSSEHLDKVVVTIKNIVKIPVILFPNNVTGISKYADAIWFMSLLNSADPYFISGAQVLAAPLIKKFNLEAMPLGYIIVGDGGSAGVIGKACPIPYNKPELAVAHALAAKYMGMRFVYLEAGSGVSQPIPKSMVSMVKETVDIPVIVGGGIRNGPQAKEITSAGADIIVTSTAIEESERISVKNKIEEIVKGIKEGVNNRITSY